MSKKMTPCEKLGYKVGDEFTVIDGSFKFGAGSVISLQEDDGTESPYFTNEGVKDEYPYGVACFLYNIKKVAKLKPAKQALADAIHQNGGWPKECHWMFATSNHAGNVSCWVCKPKLNVTDWFDGGAKCVTTILDRSMPNWHQTILSRDEYFTAYPEKVNVVVKNETEHKVEAEMTSDKEITIKVSDWHKSGELPPVGEVCLYVVSDRLSVEVEITAHAKLGICFIQVGQSGESYVSKVAELHRFHPLRTDRDKAIDEMVVCLGSRWANCEEIAAHLYENGYRKEVK